MEFLPCISQSFCLVIFDGFALNEILIKIVHDKNALVAVWWNVRESTGDICVGGFLGGCFNYHWYVLVCLIWVMLRRKSSSLSCSSFFVDCRLLRSWSRCPFAAGVIFLRTFLKFIVSIPGHDWKNPSLIAFRKVLVEGLKAHLCRYSPNFVLVWSFLTIKNIDSWICWRGSSVMSHNPS